MAKYKCWCHYNHYMNHYCHAHYHHHQSPSGQRSQSQCQNIPWKFVTPRSRGRLRWEVSDGGVGARKQLPSQLEVRLATNSESLDHVTHSRGEASMCLEVTANPWSSSPTNINILLPLTFSSLSPHNVWQILSCRSLYWCRSKPDNTKQRCKCWKIEDFVPQMWPNSAFLLTGIETSELQCTSCTSTPPPKSFPTTPVSLM